MGECQCTWHDINHRVCVFVHTIIGHRHQLYHYFKSGRPKAIHNGCEV